MTPYRQGLKNFKTIGSRVKSGVSIPATLKNLNDKIRKEAFKRKLRIAMIIIRDWGGGKILKLPQGVFNCL